MTVHFPLIFLCRSHISFLAPPLNPLFFLWAEEESRRFHGAVEPSLNIRTEKGHLGAPQFKSFLQQVNILTKVRVLHPEGLLVTNSFLFIFI